jgi:hypothetical protein
LPVQAASFVKIKTQHMKRILTLLFPILLMACNGPGPVVEGQLPGTEYANEWIYFVPIQGASAGTVDSALVRGNRFRLIPSKHNHNRIGIIRVRPQLRLSLQDIVVCAERGTVHVTLDTISSAKGTPLNEILQAWKTRKQEYDARPRAAHDKSAAAEYHSYIFRLILENKENEAGKFLYTLYKYAFTPEQLQELSIPGE